ncbi:hypothetical protein FOCC_FOCC004257 [Frankliniella occidentalis]|nr:hypothetical protein FOCC_FOCC004257 [Frankliniella occidentalis]
MSAPSAGPQGRWRESGEHGKLHDALQPPLSRVARQLPGSDILTRLSEAFREKMHQKSEGVMDAVDQVGKALGTIGDTVHQAISDGLTAGALADGGERSSAGQVGQVLSSIGDTLHKVVSGGQGDGQRSTGPQVDAASEPGADAPLGHILTSIGDKLRKVADGGEDGERALGEVGQQVGKVLTSVGDTIRDVIRERQEEGDDDDDDVARLVADPGDNGEKVPCNNGMGMMNQMNATATMMNMNARRRRGRGRRAAV